MDIKELKVTFFFFLKGGTNLLFTCSTIKDMPRNSMQENFAITQIRPGRTRMWRGSTGNMIVLDDAAEPCKCGAVSNKSKNTKNKKIIIIIIGFIIVEKLIMYFSISADANYICTFGDEYKNRGPSHPLESCGWSLNQNQQQVKQTDKIFPHLSRLFILPGFSCCLQGSVGNGNNRQQQERGRGKVFHQTSVISSSTSSPSVSPSASPSSSSSSSDVTSSSSVWETHLTQEHTNR